MSPRILATQLPHHETRLLIDRALVQTRSARLGPHQLSPILQTKLSTYTVLVLAISNASCNTRVSTKLGQLQISRRPGERVKTNRRDCADIGTLAL